jgi:hypothetical protein
MRRGTLDKNLHFLILFRGINLSFPKSIYFSSKSKPISKLTKIVKR